MILTTLLFLLSCAPSSAGASVPLRWAAFDRAEDELPVVEMRVNGRPVRAFFDTGANGITMGEATAERLGLASNAPATQGTFAGGKRSEMSPVAPVSLTAGQRRFENFPAKIVKGADRSVWRDITVGVELLRRARVAVDYSAKTLTVLDSPRLPGTKGAVAIPFEFVKGTHLMIVRAKIDGREALLHFDTGGTFALNLLEAETQRLALTIEETQAGTGGGGQEAVLQRYREAVKLCLADLCESVRPISIRGQEAMWAQVASIFGRPIAGQVSHQFFRGKQVEYDLAGKTIWIAPAK